MMKRLPKSATFALANCMVCAAIAPIRAGCHRLMLLAGRIKTFHTNPKRQRGDGLPSSLTLRVGVSCSREQYKQRLAAAVMAAICTMTVPARAGYSLPGYDLEVVQSGQGLAHAGISYLMNPTWNESGGNAYAPIDTSFTLPPCNDIDFARLYLDIWGGSPTNTASVAVSVNGTPLPTISIGGTSDANPTYNPATTCVYGSGFGTWQLAIAGVGNLLNTNGAANTVTWTVNDPNYAFDGRTYCASLVTVYTSSTLNQTLDYDLAEADGFMQNTPEDSGAPSGRTLTITGVNTANVTSATYYAGYTLGVTGQYDSLYFNGTALGANPNDVAQESPATGYGPSVVSSDVTNILSGTNTVQYSVAMPGGQTYLRANIGLLAVTHPLSATQPVDVWAKPFSGTWSTPDNWTTDVVPNVVGAAAVIDVSTTAALTITLDEPVIIGSLVLGNSDSTTVGYTLSGRADNTLTFSNSGNGATIAVTDGSHVIDAPVVLADNLVVSGSGMLAFGKSSSIVDYGNGYSLTMNGAGGTLILSGTDNYSGGTTVTAGTLILTSNTALPDGTSLTVGAGGTLIFDPSQVAAAPITLSAASPTTQAVPESGTLALLITGLVVGFAAWRRRKGIREVDPEG